MQFLPPALPSLLQRVQSKEERPNPSVVKVHFPLQRSALLHPFTPQRRRAIRTSVIEAFSSPLYNRLLEHPKNDPR